MNTRRNKTAEKKPAEKNKGGRPRKILPPEKRAPEAKPLSAKEKLPDIFKGALKEAKEASTPQSMSSELSPVQSEALKQLRSAERLLKARKARTSLIEFGQLMMPDPRDPDNVHMSRYEAQYFHRAIAAALQEVEAGRMKRLILTLPPRHGKSQLTSRLFPAWFMGRDPYRHLMFATYNEPFAQDFGRDVRNIMQSDAYKLVFSGFEFRQGSSASDRLQSKEGGLAAFVGRGGSITGRGADILIIDDPIKDHQEAKSPGVRNDTWEWFNDTAMTRLMTDKSGVIIIMTRWHEDDLVGRITDPTNPHYSAEEARKWKVINIPGLAEDDDVLGRAPGEALWPERFSREFLLSFKARNPRGFSALYQQRPTPEDGDFFTANMITTYRKQELPDRKFLRIYAASDHAVRTAQENDYTCIIVVGVDEHDVIWILDVWWKKAKTDKVVEVMVDKMREWRPINWWAAKDHIADSIGPFLFKRMRERKVWCRISQSSERGGDKEQKAQAIQGRMAMGYVKFPMEAPWFQDAKTQLLKFPNGKNDDFADTLSHIGRGLHRMIKSSAPVDETVEPVLKGPKFGTLGWVKSGHLAQRRQEVKNSVLRGG